jgi:hypothetical protein
VLHPLVLVLLVRLPLNILYIMSLVPFLFACFHKCAYTEVVVRKCTFMEVNLRICTLLYMRIYADHFHKCAFTKAHIYRRRNYGNGQLPYMRHPYMCIYGSHCPYMCIYESMHIRKPPSVDASSVYACFHICTYTKVFIRK